MNIDTNTLKNILIESGIIEEKEFEEALQASQELGKKIEDVLIFQGLINQQTIAQLVADYYKVPYIDLGHEKIPDEILLLIPERMARNYKIVPFAIEGTSVKMAMANPGDVEAIEFAKRHTGMSVIPHFASSEDIKKLLNEYKRNIRKEFDQVIEENIQKARIEGNLIQAAEKLPVIKVLDTIFEYAIAERSSDIHIESQEEQVVIRFRIDGVLKDILKLPKEIEEALVARVKILSNLKLDERRVPQDGRYKFNLNDEIVSLRISIIPGFYGENVVMRLLRESARPLSLEELGITGQNLEIVNDNIKKPNGMILVTGPTGSGKTTTLYSVLNILNSVKVKICTIEDPIEYGIKRVTQIQINPKTGLTFAAGLRALLRHDPDTIMVGEIRDGETAEIAVHAALTGHLVLSTLHTNSAVGTIPRILDMGVESFLAASTINLIVAQRLVRKLCPTCKTRMTPNSEIVEKLKTEHNIDIEDLQQFKGNGCDECRGTGYQGRLAIYEILPISEEIRTLIGKKGSTDILFEQAKKDGMITMLEDGIDKVASGQTTLEEVMRVVREN